MDGSGVPGGPATGPGGREGGAAGGHRSARAARRHGAAAGRGGDAEVVGLGESVHGASEELKLKHRVLRVPVEQAGFRSVAWEEDWTTGRLIDDYLTGAAGDPEALVARMSPQGQSREVADVLRWLRGFHVGRTAPEELPVLREHLRAIRPASADVFAHIQAYAGDPDEERYLRHARAVHDLVRTLPHAADDPEQALAEHTALQIVSFHEHSALPEADSHAHRDARAAGNLTWSHGLTGARIAYRAAGPHTANGSQLRITGPDGTEIRFACAGSHLRDRHGERYLSIGFTVDHGRAALGGGEVRELPEPGAGWSERPLGRVALDRFVLDLRAPAPSAAMPRPGGGRDVTAAGDRPVDPAEAARPGSPAR